MSTELLKNNLKKEEELLNRLQVLYSKIDSGKLTISEKNILEKSANSLIAEIKILNNALPEIINNINFYKTLGKENNSKNTLMKVKYSQSDGEKKLAVLDKDQNNFLKSVTVNSQNDVFTKDFIKQYGLISNNIFRKYSDKLINKHYFDFLRSDLKKITSSFILNSYVSIILFTTFISVIISLVLILLFFLLGAPALAFLSLLLPIITFVVAIIYPSSQRKPLEKNINQELPFLTIYLAAISTSGIEPSKIFSILANSNDYPFTQREIRKLINYVNFYGYDLVSALRTISKNCPSERLSQLFDGLSTTITSGGELSVFLNKHSESLLFDYKLEREKYTHLAETFMDIYISVVIAAPMILMMLFVLMGLTGFASGFLSAKMIGVLAVIAISIINVGFLLFLNIKQPKF